MRLFYRLLSKIIYLLIPLISKVLLILRLNSRIINQLNKLRAESHKTQNYTKLVSKILLDSVNKEFINNIEILGPFGNLNENPIFLIEKIKIIKPKIIKEKFISFFVKKIIEQLKLYLLIILILKFHITS